MKVLLGLDRASLTKGEKKAVYWDVKACVNPHGVIIGGSGTGKTTTFRKIISQVTQLGATRVHVLDFHGDIGVQGESLIQFSASSPYGLNPLRLSPNQTYGGVRKKIAEFVSTLSNASRVLGVKQEAVLRHLLKEVYEEAGFLEDDPGSWLAASNSLSFVAPPGRFYKEIDFSEKDRARELATKENLKLNWDPTVRSWYTDQPSELLAVYPDKKFGKQMPTIDTVLSAANFRIKEIYFGTSSTCVRVMEEVQACVKARQSLEKKYNSIKSFADSDELRQIQDKIFELKQKSVDLFAKHLEEYESGDEFEKMIRFKSFDVMKSIIDRLENLKGSGIFKNKDPMFDSRCSVWRSDLSALRKEERALFIEFYLQDLFAKRVEEGFSSEVKDIVIIDEAHTVFRDDEDNILNTMVLEGRKFGIGVVCASQSPEHFSADFLSGVGMTVVLGLAGVAKNKAVRMLHIPVSVMDQIAPKKIMACQFKEDGQTSYGFDLVSIPNESFTMTMNVGVG